MSFDFSPIPKISEPCCLTAGKREASAVNWMLCGWFVLQREQHLLDQGAGNAGAVG